VIGALEFRELIHAEFGWLSGYGYRVEGVHDYGARGLVATLADGQHWLKLSWETREDAVFLSWGEFLGAGKFNDDPYRNPRPLSELLPKVPPAAVMEAGTVRGHLPEALSIAFHRLAVVIRASSRFLDADAPASSPNRLPDAVASKIAAFGEISYGANRVALVMTDGGIVEDVIVAWGHEVVRVAGVDGVPFDTSHVVDAIDRS